jgi:UDP-2,3-diacylglucosamine pyrophosphatase LpxH
MQKPQHRYRTIWISDIHLGYLHCKADFLCEFLDHCHSDTLYLVGDVVDFWSLRSQWHWPASHSAVLRRLVEKARSGVRVVYVPGNHDELMRDFTGIVFGDIATEAQAVHTTAAGKRLLVTHGDEFESFISCGAFTRVLGNMSYTVLLRLNRAYNALRASQGKPYWSLATYIKNRVGNARRAIESFEDAALLYARTHGFDGVICGHIHQPRMRDDNGTTYCNDGDWVENCTALAEHQDGSLDLLDWADLRHTTMAAQVMPLPLRAAGGSR